tara:strand:+ start:84 stop:836 length:753 start_codon:yes stop_codon:yes gene_type:complete
VTATKAITNEVVMKKVENLFYKDPNNFLLIEVGANDGCLADRMRPFVSKCDPNAVMVEPLPDYFEQLKKNYSSLKNIRYENCALSDQECQKTMTYIPRDIITSGKVSFRLEGSPHLWKEHWAGGLGSFYKDKNNLGCPELKEYQKEIVVNVKTFNYLFEKYDADKYKNIVIQTDCEGHDLCILRSFDFNKIKPKMYISEIYGHTRYPPSHPRFEKEVGIYSQDDENEAKEIFIQKGYTLYRKGDLVAILE